MMSEFFLKQIEFSLLFGSRATIARNGKEGDNDLEGE